MDNDPITLDAAGVSTELEELAGTPQDNKGEVSHENWRTRIQGNGLAMQWLLSTLIGALAIHLSTEMATARLLIPFAIMMIYALTGYRHANFASTQILRTARIGQVADSLYFLGFIWTLWALIDSLVLKQMRASDAVFRTFGYALVTTATGMFLRLMLLQFTYGPSEEREGTELGLEHQVERFSVAVTRSLEAVRGLEVVLAGTGKQTQKGLDEMVETARNCLKTVSDSATVTLEPALAELAKKIKGYAYEVKDSQRLLQEKSEEMGSAMVRSAVNSTSTVLKPALEDMAKGIKASVAEMKGTNSALGNASESVETAIKRSAIQLEGAVNQLRQSVLQTATEMQVAANTMKLHVGAASTAVADVERGVRTKVEQINNLRVSPSLVEEVVTRKSSQVFSEVERAAASLRAAADRLAAKSSAETASAANPTRETAWQRLKDTFVGWIKPE